jgi:hypothetical protein
MTTSQERRRPGMMVWPLSRSAVLGGWRRVRDAEICRSRRPARCWVRAASARILAWQAIGRLAQGAGVRGLGGTARLAAGAQPTCGF